MAELTNGVFHGNGLGFIPKKISLSSNANNLDIEKSSFILIENTSSGIIDITGFDASDYDSDFVHQIRIMNVSPNDVRIMNDNALSNTSSRIFNAGSSDYTMKSGEIHEYYWLNSGSFKGWYQEV